MKNIANEIALEMMRHAKADLRRPTAGGAIAVAIGIFGDSVVCPQPGAISEANVATINGKRRIVLRPNLPPRRAHFCIAAMTARLVLERMPWAAAMGFSERVLLECSVAAALVAPEEACRPLVDLGIGAVSDAFAITWTSAAMRVGELEPERGSVVTTPGVVYRRGALLAWVSDEDIRTIASRRVPRSVRKIVIPDEPNRVALLAA